jgi:hypothetical protein
MKLHRLLTHGLHLSAEGDAPAGGGSTPPPATPPAQPPAPPPANSAGDLIKELAELKAKLAGFEGDAAKAREAEAAKRKTETDEALAAAKAAADKASGIAKSALLRAALQDIAKPDYVKLAPDVQVGEDGDLTKESKEALKKFRAENPTLFQSGHQGYTPTSGAGIDGGDGLSASERATLTMMGIDPKRTRERLAKSPLAQFVGYQGGKK